MKAKSKWQRQNELLTGFIRGQFSQNELSKMLGVSQQAVSYKEKNNAFSIEDLMIIVTKTDLDANLLKALLKVNK